MTEEANRFHRIDKSARFGRKPEGASRFKGTETSFLLYAGTAATGEKGDGKAMKRRALGLLLCVMTLLMATVALGQGMNQPVYYAASVEDWEDAMESIKAQSEAEATVILTDDVGIFNNQYKYSIGVPDKHITVKSDGEDAPYSIGGKSMSTVQLDGDVTFENVWLSLGQTSGRGGRGTVSSFYANGFTAEFTENFEQVITNLYGGGNGTTSSSTHLIINGDIICNANPQNYRVFGGGKNTSNSTTNGKVTGDVLIELGPHCRVPWVYGGGYNSSVGGNVTIILNGDINDPNHQVGNITGGGLGSSTSPTGGSAVIASTGKDSGTVTGNVNVYLYSGRFSAISAAADRTAPAREAQQSRIRLPLIMGKASIMLLSAEMSTW